MNKNVKQTLMMMAGSALTVIMIEWLKNHPIGVEITGNEIKGESPAEEFKSYAKLAKEHIDEFNEMLTQDPDLHLEKHPDPTVQALIEVSNETYGDICDEVKDATQVWEKERGDICLSCSVTIGKRKNRKPFSVADCIMNRYDKELSNREPDYNDLESLDEDDYVNYVDKFYAEKETTDTAAEELSCNKPESTAGKKTSAKKRASAKK